MPAAILCGEAEEGEVVGGDGARRVAGEEFEEALFRGGGERAVDAERGSEGRCRAGDGGRGHVWSSVESFSG